MAKKRASARPKTRGASKPRTGRNTLLRRLFRFLWLPAVRYLILLGGLIGLVLWQKSNIIAWLNTILDNTLALFGWGLVIAVAIVLVVLSLAFRRRITEFAIKWQVSQWHWWLGAIVFLFGVWGVLALFQAGGSIGLAIIGQDVPRYPIILSILRVLGIFLLSFIILLPRVFVVLLLNLFRWLRARFTRAPRPEVKPKPAAAKTAVPLPARGQPSEAAAQSQQPDLRQVAQEVWKKYGESPSLKIMDGWKLPPLDILDTVPEIEFEQVDNNHRARVIEDALASYGVEAKVVQINPGPAVTQFGIEPGWDRKMKEVREKDRDGNIKVRQEEVSKTRVKVERITGLSNDLALALAAPSIRFEAPVPGKSMVGIEVPNTTIGVVGLRAVIETTAFQKINIRSKLALALGKGAGGESVAADLSKMPHLLIAGATGSGKTVCLNAVVTCLLMHNTPNDVQFIMVDPKRVELTPFNSIPHLATPVIVDANKAVGALRWLNQEMDKRYQRMATAGARNIEMYNRTREGKDKMAYIVLIIDELADLMMAGFDEVEHIICRLAQLARATGIHLVVATQRPSVDVVTGLIKANFPTRISFAVTSQVDSRTILDTVGAEKLLGKGDMLFLPTDAAKPKRLQGCYVADQEIERLVYFWSNQKKAPEEGEVATLKIEDMVAPAGQGVRSGMPQDVMLEAARKLAKEHTQISASYLQRKLRIGYPRAARIMEQLEESGEIDNGAEVPHDELDEDAPPPR